MIWALSYEYSTGLQKIMRRITHPHEVPSPPVRIIVQMLLSSGGGLLIITGLLSQLLESESSINSTAERSSNSERDMIPDKGDSSRRLVSEDLV